MSRLRHLVVIFVLAIAGCLSPTIAYYEALAALAAARTLRHNGFPAASIQFYNAAIWAAPGKWMMHQARGAAYQSTRQYRRALSDFNMALKINPADHHTLYMRGRVNSDLGSHQDALSDFSTALEKAPGNHHYIYWRTRAQISTGQAWSAVTGANLLLAKNDGYWRPFALRLRADAYERLNKTGKMWTDRIAAKQLKCIGPFPHHCRLKTQIRFVKRQQHRAELEQTMKQLEESRVRLEASKKVLQNQSGKSAAQATYAAPQHSRKF